MDRRRLALAVVIAVIGAAGLVAAVTRGLSGADRVAADRVATTVELDGLADFDGLAPPDEAGTGETTAELEPVVPAQLQPEVSTLPTVPEGARPAGGGALGATTTTSAPAPVEVVYTGVGAELQPVGGASRRMDPIRGCASLADAGTSSRCGNVRAAGAPLVWLIEERGPWRRATVWRQASGLEYEPVLGALDSDGSRWTGAAAKVADLSGDGAEEVTFGFRRVGARQTLGIDVVGGVGSVELHGDLAAGSVRLSAGRLDTWSARPRDSSGRYDHETIEFRDGAWRRTALEQVSAEAVPPSEL